MVSFEQDWFARLIPLRSMGMVLLPQVRNRAGTNIWCCKKGRTLLLAAMLGLYINKCHFLTALTTWD